MSNDESHIFNCIYTCTCTDENGLGAERSRRDARPSPRNVPDPLPLNHDIALSILKASNEVRCVSIFIFIKKALRRSWPKWNKRNGVKELTVERTRIDEILTSRIFCFHFISSEDFFCFMPYFIFVENKKIWMYEDGLNNV